MNGIHTHHSTIPCPEKALSLTTKRPQETALPFNYSLKIQQTISIHTTCNNYANLNTKAKSHKLDEQKKKRKYECP